MFSVVSVSLNSSPKTPQLFSLKGGKQQKHRFFYLIDDFSDQSMMIVTVVTILLCCTLASRPLVFFNMSLKNMNFWWEAVGEKGEVNPSLIH